MDCTPEEKQTYIDKLTQLYIDFDLTPATIELQQQATMTLGRKKPGIEEYLFSENLFNISKENNTESFMQTVTNSL